MIFNACFHRPSSPSPLVVTIIFAGILWPSIVLGQVKQGEATGLPPLFRTETDAGTVTTVCPVPQPTPGETIQKYTVGTMENKTAYDGTTDTPLKQAKAIVDSAEMEMKAAEKRFWEVAAQLEVAKSRLEHARAVLDVVKERAGKDVRSTSKNREEEDLDKLVTKETSVTFEINWPAIEAVDAENNRISLIIRPDQPWERGGVDPESKAVAARTAQQVKELQKQYGVRPNSSFVNVEVAKDAEIVGVIHETQERFPLRLSELRKNRELKSVRFAVQNNQLVVVRIEQTR